MADYWTDYPLSEFGDSPHREAPVRQVELVAYDGNKYVQCLFAGLPVTIKAGYIYASAGRAGTATPISRDDLASLPRPTP